MITRANGTSTVKTIKENRNRQPFSDKTNNENTSNNMKPEKNEKSTLGVRQTRKNNVRGQQNENKNPVGCDTNNTINNNVKPKNTRKLKTVAKETKATIKTNVKDNTENKANNNLLELEQQKILVNENKRSNIRRRSSRLSIETKDKTTSESNKGSSKSNKDISINKENINVKSNKQNENKENTINAQNILNVKRRSSRFSSETIIKPATKSKKGVTKSNIPKINKEASSNKDTSKLGTILQENLQQKDVSNNLINKQNEKSESNKTKRRSSRNSIDTKIKITSKSNKDASNKNVLKSNKDILKSNEDLSKLDTTFQETDNTDNSKIKQNELETEKIVESNQKKEEIKNTSSLKPKRLLTLKSPSPENSDPYEFKFNPNEEPKRKPKKRRRPNKFDTLSDTSEEEDNSMKPIVKNIRKLDLKQKILLTPVERKLRNRTVKVERKIAPKIKLKNSEKIVENVNSTAVNTNTDIINTTPAKNTSVLDEINEIANTFLEDDDVYDSDISMNTPSRIDIISNLIARKSIKNPPTSVFNSTMIPKTPQQQHLSPGLQSPWRIEVSAISRKSLNFSVKNKSFTPSYTPEIITDNKKQSTLLGFVNRTPKPDLQVTLFQNSPTRKPFENLSNSMSPVRSNRSGVSAAKRSDDSLFGFTVLSDSEDKENSPVVSGKVKPPRNNFKIIEKKETHFDDIKIHEPELDIPILLFEDQVDKRNEKRYSRQYTRPQPKRKRNVSFKIDSDDSDSEIEIHPIKKKQKDVFSKEEAEEADRLASHYNSYFEEIENYPLCIE